MSGVSGVAGVARDPGHAVQVGQAGHTGQAGMAGCDHRGPSPVAMNNTRWEVIQMLALGMQ